MKALRTILILILVLLILAVGGGLYATLHVDNLVTSFPKLSIRSISGDIPVGGMTKAEIVETLNANGWKDRISTPLTVTTLGNQSFSVDPLKSGVVLTAEDVADFVYAYGRSSNPIENTLTWVRNLIRPVTLELPDLNADRAYLLSLIEENQAAVTELLGETEYVPEYEEGRLALVKGWGQLELDREALCDAIIEALKEGRTELSFTRLAKDLTAPDFQAIYTELKKEPQDARFTDDGRFDVIDETVGCSFDVAAAKQMWEAAAPAEAIEIPMEVTWPDVTAEYLRSTLFHDLLGACTTNYWNSTENRCSNVQLASSKINDTILYPGDVFSYNEVVGERTTEAGFLPAPAYVNGDVKDEIGGGACQVSSTLYCATVFAFLETVERENHYFPVHYMQLGTDATVTIPGDGGRTVDFKFRNNKNYPIKIVAYCDTETRDLTFEIWGTLEDDDYMPIEFDNTRGWEFTYDRLVDKAYPDRMGYKIKLEVEKYYFSDEIGDGSRTLTHRLVYDENGELVEDELTNALLPNGGPAMDTYYDYYG